MKKLIILLIAIFAFGCNRGKVFEMDVNSENSRKPTFITREPSIEIVVLDSSWTTLEASLDSTIWTTLDTLFSDTVLVNNLTYRFYRVRFEGGSNVENIYIHYYKYHKDSTQINPIK
jgi:hypothetical protein